MFEETVVQRAELSQSGFLAFPYVSKSSPPSGKGHEGRQGDNDNFYQGIGFVPFDS
jgi:hypothetical protein